MVKCGDYFQAEDGPREFGNICINTKWIKSTTTSLVLRHLEVSYKEVSLVLKILLKNSNSCYGFKYISETRSGD